jgi:hypothetical protein
MTPKMGPEMAPEMAPETDSVTTIHPPRVVIICKRSFLRCSFPDLFFDDVDFGTKPYENSVRDSQNALIFVH